MSQTLKILIPLAIVFSILIATNFIYAAWGAPSGDPSASNNASKPINVSARNQMKEGDITAVNLKAGNKVWAFEYCDKNGANCFSLQTTTNSSSVSVITLSYPKIWELIWAEYTADGMTIKDGVHNDAVTAAHICSIVSDTAVVAHVTGEWFSSPNDNWVAVYNGSKWQQKGANSFTGSNSTIGELVCAYSGEPNTTYLWKLAWVGCTAPYVSQCDGYSQGTETSSYSCVENISGDIVEDAKCEGQVQPAPSTQACFYYAPACRVDPRCFIAGTNVTMADGTKKNIEDVEIGESVLGKDGVMNEVLDFERPMLGSRHLYSINNGPFFITPAHPLLTTDGWKSIDVNALHYENKTLVEELGVHTLQIGDTLVREDGENVIVNSIEGKSAPNQQLYNFILSGDRTYYVDGYLTHNEFSADEY